MAKSLKRFNPLNEPAKVKQPAQPKRDKRIKSLGPEETQAYWDMKGKKVEREYAITAMNVGSKHPRANIRRGRGQ